MQSLRHIPSEHSLLRFVFRDTVMSFAIGDHVTLGEIAQTLGEVSDDPCRRSAGIDVTLKTSEELSNWRYFNPVGIVIIRGPRGGKPGFRVLRPVVGDRGREKETLPGQGAAQLVSARRRRRARCARS